MTRSAVLVLAVAALGCGGSLSSGSLRNAPNAPNRADVQKRIQELEGGRHN